jgi:hypothetical protein
MIAAVPHFGANAGAIWTFAVGIIAVFLFMAILLMGINMIRRFIQ